MSFATKIGATVQYGFMDFWSAFLRMVAMTTTATDINLPNVVIAGLPASSTVHRVIFSLYINAMSNSSAGGNGLNGAQNIRLKASAGTWGVDDIVALALIADQWGIAQSVPMFSLFAFGSADLSSKVVGVGTYNIRFEDALAQANNLYMFEVQCQLRVYYTI
jgi:hypothetical protein